MKVNKDCKCMYCHWYRPKKEQRCWGFSKEDIKECIKNGYESFKKRNVALLRKIAQANRKIINKK